MIKVKDYPQLKSIMWDFHCDEVEESVAFDLYERRFDYMDWDQITRSECQLIKELAQTYGNGHFLVRSSGKLDKLSQFG